MKLSQETLSGPGATAPLFFSVFFLMNPMKPFNFLSKDKKKEKKIVKRRIKAICKFFLQAGCFWLSD